MMGDAQFRKGEFFEAAATYNYTLRLYSSQPNVASVAKARLARCYVALNWPYDAEDLLNKMKRDSITRRGQKDFDNTKAGYYVLTHQYEEAIPHLKNAIKSTRGKIPKARLNFLLAQLYHETGRDTMAYKTLSKVIRANPPYEVAFNARIMQTEVMHKGKFRQMIARLKRMARSDKNKDYLDRVYYAMGNIYLSNEDTTHCIYAWEKGLKESTKSGPDKATLLLHLSQLYWEQENYIDAARTYKECVSALDKEHLEYKETERRSKILTDLEPHLSTIKLQDSLQVLAESPEEVYLAAIDRVIAELRKKEKEEAKKAAANGTLNPNAPNNGLPTPNMPGADKPALAKDLSSFGNQQQGDWYFYNPSTVKSGTQEFQRRWGMRRNEDYWRISNKQTLLKNAEGAEGFNFDEAAADSLYGAVGDAASDSISAAEKARKDSLANDPHHREYYLKQIPFTEEQLAESNRLLGDALYNAGIQEQEQLENFPLAERTMIRFLNDFPEHDGIDNVFYHLFLLYGRLGDMEGVEQYKAYLLEDFPEAKLSALIGNPYYEMIAREGKHVETDRIVFAGNCRDSLHVRFQGLQHR
jgi:tetratricopeptide (TPR) repeat protein